MTLYTGTSTQNKYVLRPPLDPKERQQISFTYLGLRFAKLTFVSTHLVELLHIAGCDLFSPDLVEKDILQIVFANLGMSLL